MSVTPEQKLRLLKARAEDLMTMVDAVIAEFTELDQDDPAIWDIQEHQPPTAQPREGAR
jgi:hypothetical protein